MLELSMDHQRTQHLASPLEKPRQAKPRQAFLVPEDLWQMPTTKTNLPEPTRVLVQAVTL